jgi:hypothetical protein
LLGGPLNLLFVGTTFVFVSEGVRMLHDSPARFPGAMRGLSAAVTAIAIGWSVVVLLLPDTLGSHLLGSTWPHTESLLPVLVLFVVALAISIGPTQGMLALGAARRSLFTQFAGMGVDLPSMTGGAVLAGARGAAMATGLAAVFRTTLAWVQFRRALREPVASVGSEVAELEVPEVTAS